MHPVDNYVTKLLRGEVLTKEEHLLVVECLQERISRGEQGDDIPVLMELVGCDYEAATRAVFESRVDDAIQLLLAVGVSA